jgi:hypothetical protein
MLLISILLLPAVLFSAASAGNPDQNLIPKKYVDLRPYVQPAPDQGETNTCLFVAATGAIETLLNQKYDVRNPQPGDRFDLSERWTITYPNSYGASDWRTEAITKFQDGWTLHQNVLPFEAKTKEGAVNWDVWSMPPNFYKLPKQVLKEKFEEFPLFIRGGKYATYVLTEKDLLTVKKALVQHEAPILITYNDEGWWHTILIVGYDDELKGDCYFTPQEECRGRGAFFVRDSAGIALEARDYDWFRVNGNAAFVVRIAN